MSINLWAISDLHLGHRKNRDALLSITPRPSDWLIVAGDVGETEVHLRMCYEILAPRFAQLIWVPGNHELYTTPRDPCQQVGQARYRYLVEVSREYGVLTPEDPWPLWPGDGPPTRIAPLFIGYDYSFGPPGRTPEQVVEWAALGGIRSADERYLSTEPYQSAAEWCAARLAETRARLDTVASGERLVLINHYPLRRDLIRLFRIPRFVPWCGTRETTDWHRTYPVDVVVNGHLHMRATDWRDGVRFEEVALGYPRHWDPTRTIDAYLRQILPRVPATAHAEDGPIWHR
ncbi:MAG: metallophosphoesterase [Myxococcota bacterium]